VATNLIVAGNIVALDPADPDRTRKGRVVMGGDGLIDTVKAGTSASGSGTHVDAGDVWVFPGVIDLHNHIAYNTLPLWTEPSQTKAFAHHNSWPGKATYQPGISWPAWTLARCEPDALLAYVETKALIGGTTAIQGSPGSNRRRDNWLVRNIDDEAFGTTNRDLIFTSVLTLPPADLQRRATDLSNSSSFIYHCSEGAPGTVVMKEYAGLRSAQCLKRGLIAVHCNAITDFSDWHASPGAVVWSPFSNLWLYGATTDVLAARSAGVTVCLGSDWAPSGTKHVLGELKVADIWNQQQQLGLTDRELVEMVTANPGDVLARAWPHQAGRIVPGALGDLTVVTKRTNDPWRDLITTREKDVALVVINGVARYGLPALMTAAGTKPVGPITVGGQKRTISIPRPEDLAKQWSWTSVVQKLNSVRADPKAALLAAEAARAVGGIGLPGPPPLQLQLDMPTGAGPTAGPPPPGVTPVVPPLDGLTHTPAWLGTIPNRGFHGGVLDELATYYAN
jgi:hypothetical protein